MPKCPRFNMTQLQRAAFANADVKKIIEEKRSADGAPPLRKAWLSKLKPARRWWPARSIEWPDLLRLLGRYYRFLRGLSQLDRAA